MKLNGIGVGYDFRVDARTYRAAGQVTLAANPTDVFEIFGNATTTVIVTQVCVSGLATSAGEADMLLIKRSAAPSGGTSSNLTVVPLDASDIAANSTPRVWTANTTPGAAVGAIGRTYVPLSTAAASAESDHCWDFGTKGKGVVLSGTAQGLVLNLNGVTITGGVLNISVEWIEL